MKSKVTFNTKILFILIVVSLAVGCSFSMLQPEAKKMKKIALLTVYVKKQGFFKGFGADRKVANKVDSFYEAFEEELGNVKGWKIVPLSKFSGNRNYKAFYKSVTSKTGYSLAKKKMIIGKNMVFLERGMFMMGDDQKRIKKLLKTMDVDGAIIIGLKLKFVKSGGFAVGNIGTSNKKAESTVDLIIVDKNANYAGGGLRSFTSTKEIKGIKFGIDTSNFKAAFQKNGEMFDEAVRNSAVAYRNLLNKELSK